MSSDRPAAAAVQEVEAPDELTGGRRGGDTPLVRCREAVATTQGRGRPGVITPVRSRRLHGGGLGRDGRHRRRAPAGVAAANAAALTAVSAPVSTTPPATPPDVHLATCRMRGHGRWTVDGHSAVPPPPPQSSSSPHGRRRRAGGRRGRRAPRRRGRPRRSVRAAGSSRRRVGDDDLLMHRGGRWSGSGTDCRHAAAPLAAVPRPSAGLRPRGRQTARDGPRRRAGYRPGQADQERGDEEMGAMERAHRRVLQVGGVERICRSTKSPRARGDTGSGIGGQDPVTACPGTKLGHGRFTDRARMAESVDARDLGSRGATRPSSSLGPRTSHPIER